MLTKIIMGLCWIAASSLSYADVDIKVLDDGTGTSIDVSGSINTSGIGAPLATHAVTGSAGIGVGVIPTTSTSVAGIYRSSTTTGNVYSGILSSNTSEITQSQSTQGATYATGRTDAGGSFGIDNKYIYLDTSYLSGSPISYSLSYPGKSATNLGFPHANKSWVIGGNRISLSVLSIPGIVSLSQASGGLSGGTPITITGYHFTGTSAVTIAGRACTNLSVVNDTKITCITSQGPAGPASVVITTPEGANQANTLFTYSNTQSIIPFSASSNVSTIPVGGSATLLSSGGAGRGEVIYRLVSGGCSLRGSTVLGSSSGPCVVIATKISDGIYAALDAPRLVISVGSLSAPANVRATSGSGQISVAFTPSTGGSGSVTYSVACTSTDGGISRSATGSSSPILVAQGTVGKSYTCTVTATDSTNQTSSASAASNTVLVSNVEPAPIPTLSELSQSLLILALAGVMGWTLRGLIIDSP